MNGTPSYKSRQKKYVPDLQGFMVLCETNYARALKLLPQIQPVNTSFDYSVRDKLGFRITIVECCKYTTIVKISQTSPALVDYLKPELEVRLYHDAGMAEVSASQNVSRLKPRYDYPNPDMRQRDEKYQVNVFLAEWLKLCLEYGQVSVDLSSY